MRVAKWDPFKSSLRTSDPTGELEGLAERENRLAMRSAAGSGEALVTADCAPIVDIQESAKEYLEDVEVTNKDGVRSRRLTPRPAGHPSRWGRSS